MQGPVGQGIQRQRLEQTPVGLEFLTPSCSFFPVRSRQLLQHLDLIDCEASSMDFEDFNCSATAAFLMIDEESCKHFCYHPNVSHRF